MSAHILTALRGIAKSAKGESTARQFRHALSFAPLGDNLEYLDWLALDKLPDSGLLEAAIKLIPYYTGMWDALGQPCTAEEWQKRKYGPIPNDAPHDDSPDVDASGACYSDADPGL